VLSLLQKGPQRTDRDRQEASNTFKSIQVSDAAATPPNSAAPSGERRHVTVLFADMAGFTAISEHLGEEDTFALIQFI
jgi:class 3 adenylate cyclase